MYLTRMEPCLEWWNLVWNAGTLIGNRSLEESRIDHDAPS